MLDAMPSTNLKPENDEELLEEDRVYRTTYMFSATMPQAVERLARKYLRRPVVITIGSAGKAVDRITQRVVIVKDNEKPPLLEREITCGPPIPPAIYAASACCKGARHGDRRCLGPFVPELVLINGDTLPNTASCHYSLTSTFRFDPSEVFRVLLMHADAASCDHCAGTWVTSASSCLPTPRPTASWCLRRCTQRATPAPSCTAAKARY